ncbi:hypothetical protein PAPYR_4454 [Paratrimastix pyriformis]|uniref:TmcB/TmcC TPR repeats domain-containing protein n=1 Tax=Paratrimastix pyriformis TaxID=342808 RepID=A0ABQ8UQS0_9EUKA|nr:hypothetical protein PAPYR_4454 [Paratrimastix pyriformis]
MSSFEEACFNLFWVSTKENDFFSKLVLWCYIWQFLQYAAPSFSEAVSWRWNVAGGDVTQTVTTVWRVITLQIFSTNPILLWSSFGVVALLVATTLIDAFVVVFLFRHERVFLFPIRLLRTLSVSISTFLFMPCLGLLLSVTSPAVALDGRWEFPGLIGTVLSLAVVAAFLPLDALASAFMFAPCPKPKQALGRPNAHFDLLLLGGKLIVVALTKYWASDDRTVQLALQFVTILLLTLICIWGQPYFRMATNMMFAGGLAILATFSICACVVSAAGSDAVVLCLVFPVAVAAAAIAASLSASLAARNASTALRARSLWLYRPGQPLHLLPVTRAGLSAVPTPVDMLDGFNDPAPTAVAASATQLMRSSGASARPADGGLDLLLTSGDEPAAKDGAALTHEEALLQQKLARTVRRYRSAIDVDRATRFLLSKRYRTKQHIAYADRIYQHALRSKHLRYDAGLYVRYALFQLAFMKDPTRASSLIAKAAALSPSLEYRFLIYGNLKDSEASAVDAHVPHPPIALAQVAAKDTVMTMLATKKNTAEAERYHRKVRRHMKDAWGLLLMPHVDVQLLQRELNEAMTAADKAEAAYVLLLEQNPNSIAILRSFGALQQEFYGNEALAESLFLRADVFEEERSKRHPGGDTDSVSMASTSKGSRSSKQRNNETFEDEIHTKSVVSPPPIRRPTHRVPIFTFSAFFSPPRPCRKTTVPFYCRPGPQVTLLLLLCGVAVLAVMLVARENLLKMADQTAVIQSISEVASDAIRITSLLHLAPVYLNRAAGTMGTAPVGLAGTLVLSLAELLATVDRSIAKLRHVYETAVDPRMGIWQVDARMLLSDMICLILDKASAIRDAIAEGIYWRDTDLRNMLFLFDNVPAALFRQLVTVAQDYLLESTASQLYVQTVVPAVGGSVAALVFLVGLLRVLAIIGELKRARGTPSPSSCTYPRTLHQRLRMVVSGDDGDEQTDLASVDERTGRSSPRHVLSAANSQTSVLTAQPGGGGPAIVSSGSTSALVSSAVFSAGPTATNMIPSASAPILAEPGSARSFAMQLPHPPSMPSIATIPSLPSLALGKSVPPALAALPEEPPPGPFSPAQFSVQLTTRPRRNSQGAVPLWGGRSRMGLPVPSEEQGSDEADDEPGRPTEPCLVTPDVLPPAEDPNHPCIIGSPSHELPPLIPPRQLSPQPSSDMDGSPSLPCLTPPPPGALPFSPASSPFLSASSAPSSPLPGAFAAALYAPSPLQFPLPRPMSMPLTPDLLDALTGLVPAPLPAITVPLPLVAGPGVGVAPISPVGAPYGAGAWPLTRHSSLGSQQEETPPNVTTPPSATGESATDSIQAVSRLSGPRSTHSLHSQADSAEVRSLGALGAPPKLDMHADPPGPPLHEDSKPSLGDGGDHEDEAARAVDELAAAEVARQMTRISVLPFSTLRNLLVGVALFCVVIMAVLCASMLLLGANQGFAHDITASALREAVLHQVHFSAQQLFLNLSACTLAASITGQRPVSPPLDLCEYGEFRSDRNTVRAQLEDYVEVFTGLHCLIRYGYGQCNLTAIQGHPLLGVLRPPGAIDPTSQRARIMYDETTCLMGNTTICRLYPDRLRLSTATFSLNALVFAYAEQAHTMVSMTDRDLLTGIATLDRMTRSMIYDLDGGCSIANDASSSNAVNTLSADANVLGYMMLALLAVLPLIYGVVLARPLLRMGRESLVTERIISLVPSESKHSMLLDWQRTEPVGVRGVDDQHRRLSEYAAQLTSSVIAGHDRTTLHRLLELLDRFLRHHSAYEMRLARRYQMTPEDVQAHEADHARIMAMVCRFLNSALGPPLAANSADRWTSFGWLASVGQVTKAQGDLKVSSDLLLFVKAFARTVPEHIRRHDAPLGRWVATKGTAPGTHHKVHFPAPPDDA